jgi:DNA-binding NarL/FixJ family response regulator
MLASFHGEPEHTHPDGEVRICCVVLSNSKQVRPAVIRILVVEDHEMVRSNLCILLNGQPDFSVVAQVSTGLDAVRKAQEFQPDVVVLDLGIPEVNGIHATPLIKNVAPKAEILIVTQFDDWFFARQVFSAGARGFLTKTDLTSELILAVRQVHAKKQFVSEGLRRQNKSFRGDPEDQDSSSS